MSRASWGDRLGTHLLQQAQRNALHYRHSRGFVRRMKAPAGWQHLEAIRIYFPLPVTGR